jgi:hypothetical protein
MTPPGIEPATFRFVAQYLNHCATATPSIIIYIRTNYLEIVALYPAGYILLPGQKAGLIHHSTNAEYFITIFPETITFNFPCHDKK